MIVTSEREEIDAAKVAALVAVLKDALPELVTITFTRLKAELRRIVPGLSDDEWETLVREENQRRARRRSDKDVAQEKAEREWKRRRDEWLNLMSFGEWVEYFDAHGTDPKPDEVLAKWESEGDPRAAKLKALIGKNRAQ